MDNTLDNGTLKEILDQLKNLNTNLSTGNLLGEKNKLFRQQNQPTGWDAFNISQKQKRDLDREKLERFRKLAKTGSTEKLRQEASEMAQKKRLEYIKHSAGAATTPEAVITAVKGITNMIFTVLETNIKKQGIKLQTASELQTRAIQTYGKALNNAISVQVGNVTGNVLDTAYQSLNAVIDGGRAIYMKNLADAITYRKQENEIFKANAERNAAIAESLGGSMAAFGGTVGIIGNALSAIASVGKRAAMVIAAQTQLEIQRNEEVKKNQDEWLQQIEGVVKTFADMSKQVTKSFLEAGNSAYAYGRTLGLSPGALRKYQDTLIESVNVELSKINMDYKDYVKMQESYNEATGGRTSVLGGEEASMLGALSMRLGIGAEQAATIVGSMNIFNTSIADGSEMIYKMAKTANSMGLSATKFAKDMERNLKLAEKYQFRGGVRGLMDMALWAQKTRFNIEEMGSLQEKMLSGNIEDVIQTSARLNVLGGNAALYSDPMSMLYNGLVNPRGLAENINKMVAGYGTFDRKTGDTTFSTVEMLRMNAIAQATGMSRENIMNQARQARKSEDIRRQYGNKFNKQDLEAITQHATWNEKKGWVVKVNAPGEPGGFVEKGLNEIDVKQDLQNIFPEDKQDQLIDLVREIYKSMSAGEEQAASDKYAIAGTMGEASKRDIDSLTRMMAEEKRYYTDVNKENYGEMIEMFTKTAMETQKALNEAVNSGDMTKLVGKYTVWATKNYTDMLKEMTSFAISNKSIDDSLKEIRDKYVGVTSDFRKEGKFIATTKAERAEYNKNNPLTKEEFVELQKIVKEKYNIDEKRFENLWKENVYVFDKIENRLIDYGTSETAHKPLRTFKLDKPLIQEKVEDAIITPSGAVYTHPNDLIAAFKPGGAISQSLNGVSRIETNGTFKNQTVEDAIITPRGAVYTHPNDLIAAFKSGGVMSQSLNGVSRIEVSGTLKLDSGAQSVDLMELIRNNPQSIRRITEDVIIQASKNKYGGRQNNAPDRYTL